jgi:NAD(P)H-hydrate epimerase
MRGVATTHFLFTEKLARRYLPVRKENSNKSNFGHLLVCAGREGMWGAGLLAASSAYRFGAGYVTWGSFDNVGKAGFESPEIMTVKLDRGLPKNIKEPTAIVVGPGLGVTDQTLALIKDLQDKNCTHVVLDADAITLIAQHKLYPLPETWVLTPHAGELARLMNTDAHEVERDRFEWALRASKKVGCHVLLKGYRSILAHDNRTMIIHSGNAALAKAGSGDVLSGMIGALMAQGLDPVQATATAAYVHGRIADEWVRQGFDKRSLLPSDIRDNLPQLLGRITGSKL